MLPLFFLRGFGRETEIQRSFRHSHNLLFNRQKKRAWEMASNMSELLFGCGINKKISEQRLYNFSVENSLFSLCRVEKVTNIRNNLDGGFKRF